LTDNHTRPYGSSPAPYDGTSPERRAVREARARRSVEFGTAWIIGGLLFTVTVHEQAQGAGASVVAWGPVFYGGYRIVSGLRLRNRSRELP
jgi:hypothetical protein